MSPRLDWPTRLANAVVTLSILFFALQILPTLLHNLNHWWLSAWH